MENRKLGAMVALTVLCMVLAYQAGLFNYFINRDIAAGRFDDALTLRVFDGALDRQFLRASRVKSEFDNEWLGVEVRQYANDLLIYHDIIWQVKPDVIVESGTFAGGLTLYLSSVLQYANPKGRIISVDIDSRRWDDTLAKFSLPGGARDQLVARVDFVKGSSVAPETIDKIKALIPPGSKVVVILDSLHTRDHVLQELKLYSPLVTAGSYLVVNDTDLDGIVENLDVETYVGVPNGVGAALKEWLPSNKQFEADKKMDRFSITCVQGGILKRVE
jgi:cephalosporin hydroxylase